MDIQNYEDVDVLFEFLVKRYGFKHSYQEFPNGYDRNVFVITHSFYNDNGCFTIHYAAQICELSFFRSKRFGETLDQLTERNICAEVFSAEKDIWDKYNKLFWRIPNPFFEYNISKNLKALAEVIQAQIDKTGKFFGISIQ